MKKLLLFVVLGFLFVFPCYGQTIYIYHTDTGEYLYVHPPLEPNAPVKIMNGTAIAPPKVAADEVAIFKDGKWTASKELYLKKRKAEIQSELAELDKELPRIAEDIIAAAKIDESTLPQEVQDRLKAKRTAREEYRKLSK